MPPPPTRPMPPPWEVVVAVAEFMDPATLAAACCVSKSWRAAATSANLWLPHCLTHFPSSSHLLALSPPASPRRLFSVLRRAASARRAPPPPSPRLSLRHLLFTLDVSFPNLNKPLLSAVKPGEDVEKECCGGVFRFDVEVAAEEEEEEMRVVWMAVRKGWGGAFLVMEAAGKGRAVGDSGVWFEEELLAGPKCCAAAAAVAEVGGVMVAEVGMVFCGEGRRVGRVSLGFMRRVGCRYVSVLEAVLYLQPFLLPPPLGILL